MFDWNTVQQALRIAMNGVGVWLMSKGWPEETTLALTGAVLSGGAVLWWWIWERKRATEAAA